jgi:CobQ-like glutamine amidotransferase family enzyme
MQINIACLYSDLLNIYGDRGNVIAFTKRCQWRGVEVNTFEIKIGDVIDPEKYDFYFIGGGQDQQQIAVSFELQKQKDALHLAAGNGAVFLAICGGYQLFGHYYKPHKGDELRGISLLDAYTVAGHNRYIGNVAIKTDFPLEKADTLTGFENHSGLTYLEEGTVPIGTVITGNGNNGKDKTEGARKRNVFGTYLHGSFLPKNPHFTDYLIKLSLERKYGQVELAEIDDDFEWLAHHKAVKRKY